MVTPLQRLTIQMEFIIITLLQQILTSTAADFMEQQERYRNKIYWLACLMLVACAQSPRVVLNRSEANIRTQAGITYVNNRAFTGTLFQLSSEGRDTIVTE